MALTFLTDQQIWGEGKQRKGQLQVMKAYGTKTGMSDLAILLGAVMLESNTTTSDGQRAGFVWSASSGGDGSVRAVNGGGDRDYSNPDERYCGARPALPSSVTSSIRLREAKPSKKISGVDIVEYGEYPQTIADENITKELEWAFSKNQLQKTSKTYNFDSEKCDACDKPFKAKEYAEYEHKGKRYIRVQAKPFSEDQAKPFSEDSVLSNGQTPAKGKKYWIEVKPIEWLKDPSGVWVARQALFAGVQFDKNGNYHGNFAQTGMYNYLQKHFAKEMLPQQQVGQDTETGHAQAERSRRKEALRPIIDAVFDALSLHDFDAQLREVALDAAVDAQINQGRKRG